MNYDNRHASIGRLSGEIPEHTHAALVRYIFDGHRPGDFLQAVLCNQLIEAHQRADDGNLVALPLIVSWIYNQAPAICHHSAENYSKWIAKGGLNGLRATRAATTKEDGAK